MWVIPMIERERGWGQKCDGYAGPFETKDEALKYSEKYNKKYNNATEVPDYYVAPAGPVYSDDKKFKCDYGNKI